ncbi:MAG: carboxymuconolactone decarboxylase family protein [Verrucomicrobium sp.]|nr:carboxymuconolactone decarboxylase family protein [Verrucomicrobium sp.]
MSRIAQITPEQATGQTAQIYGSIQKQLGGVPNIFQALGAHPQALAAFLNLHSGLTTLSGADKEALALIVAEENGCDYCLAAHTFLGRKHGLSTEETLVIRQGGATDPKRNALIRMAREIVDRKGRVSDEAYQAYLDAGYTEAQVPEVLLAVVENLFTNYFNNLNGTAIDFPAAPALTHA